MPLALSFDTGGPMARHVHDLAVVINGVTGVDPRDPATAAKLPADFPALLTKDALKSARFGVLSDFFGADPKIDAILETSIKTLRAQGAMVVHIKLPDYVPKIRSGLFNKHRAHG